MYKSKFLMIIYVCAYFVCSWPLIASQNLNEIIPLEQLKFQPTTRDDWRVKGDYDQRNVIKSGSYSLSQEFISLSCETLLNSFCFEKIVSNKSIDISIFYDFNRRYKILIPSLGSYFKPTTVYTGFFTSNSPDAINRSLQLLYNMNAIPDFIIDRILELPEFGVHDFRLNTHKLIAEIEQEFAPSNDTDAEKLPEKTDADLQDFITCQLKTIHNDKQRQETSWGIVQYLQQQDYCPNAIIIELCKEITDKNLPFYSSALELIAAQQFTKITANTFDIEQRFREPITTLFKASAASEQDLTIPSQLPIFIKTFINNGTLADDTPETLVNLKFSPEHMFELLNLYRLQKLEVQALNSKINKLQAENFGLKQLHPTL